MSDQSAISMRERLASQPKQEVIAPAAVMTRAADAMHRIDRIAEQMEKAADEMERQLKRIRERL